MRSWMTTLPDRDPRADVLAGARYDRAISRRGPGDRPAPLLRSRGFHPSRRGGTPSLPREGAKYVVPANPSIPERRNGRVSGRIESTCPSSESTRMMATIAPAESVGSSALPTGTMLRCRIDAYTWWSVPSTIANSRAPAEVSAGARSLVPANSDVVLHRPCLQYARVSSRSA